MIKVDKEGTSAYEIIRVAKKYGIFAIGYKNYTLDKMHNFPFIAHTIINNTQHFIVILKIKNSKILINDPAKGIYSMDIKDFNKIYTGISIIFKKEEILNKKSLINLKFTVLITIIILFLALLNIIYSYFLSYLIENFKYQNNILIIILLFSSVGILKEIVNLIKEKLLLHYQVKIDKMITIPILKKIINLPHKYYQEKPFGQIMSKINDLAYIKQMIFLITQVLFVNVIIILVSFIFLFIINKYIFILNLIILLILFFYNKHFYLIHSYKNYDLQIKNETLNANISDGISSIINIKNLCKEKYLEQKIVNLYNETITSYKKLNILYQNKNLLFNLFVLVSYVFSIIFIIKFNGSISNMLFTTYLISIIFDCMGHVLSLFETYAEFKSALIRIKEICDVSLEEDSVKNVDIKNIYFKNVDYKYKDKIIFKDFNLKIKKGELIMLSGPCGCGKTTLFKMLTKQINCNNKKIFINKESIDNYSNKILRKNITYVDQKSRLLNASILENICLNSSMNLKPKFKKLLDEILRKRNIDYNTIIDNFNSNLSGGELMLILMAQNLNNSGSVIIFDETTSNMDFVLERKVIKAIKNDYKDKIIILITHRFTNKDLFDKVIYFPDRKKLKNRRFREKIKRKRIKTN